MDSIRAFTFKRVKKVYAYACDSRCEYELGCASCSCRWTAGGAERKRISTMDATGASAPRSPRGPQTTMVLAMLDAVYDEDYLPHHEVDLVTELGHWCVDGACCEHDPAAQAA